MRKEESEVGDVNIIVCTKDRLEKTVTSVKSGQKEGEKHR